MDERARTALDRLEAGNVRFAQGRMLNRFASQERAASVAGQRPFAVVVGCSDSRVPVEAVFDAGVGELFVVRTAGHVLAAASLASIRFAVEKLGAPLVLVLGHEDCGAVSAALSGETAEWLAPILSHIDVSDIDVSKAPDDADDPLLGAAVDSHVRDTVAELERFIMPFAPSVAVAGAAYRLASGRVHWLSGD
jgi:carbonic anhydrase